MKTSMRIMLVAAAVAMVSGMAAFAGPDSDTYTIVISTDTPTDALVSARDGQPVLMRACAKDGDVDLRYGRGALPNKLTIKADTCAFIQASSLSVLTTNDGEIEITFLAD